MFPVSEANFVLREKKTGFLSHIGHKTAAAIDDNGDPENGVFLLFFLF